MPTRVAGDSGKILIAGLSIFLSLVTANCGDSRSSYPPDDSFEKGQAVNVPLEFQRGSASIEQAKAWIRAMLMSDGAIAVEER